MHDERIDQPQLPVPEHLRQGADNREAQAVPQPDCRDIGADHEIELHGQEPGRARLLQAMQAKLAPDASPAGARGHHERCVRHMAAQADLVGNELVHRHDYPTLFSHVRRHTGAAPVRERVRLAGLGRKNIGRSGRHHFLEDGPHGREIGGDGGTEMHGAAFAVTDACHIPMECARPTTVPWRQQYARSRTLLTDGAALTGAHDR